MNHLNLLLFTTLMLSIYYQSSAFFYSGNVAEIGSIALKKSRISKNQSSLYGSKSDFILSSPAEDMIEIINKLQAYDELGDLGMKAKESFSKKNTTNSIDESASNDTYIHPLLRDIDMLSGILGEVIKRESPEVFTVFTVFFSSFH